MKKIICIILTILLVFSFSFTIYAYNECDGYSTQVLDEKYYEKFKGLGVEINVCNWGEYVANDSVNFLDVNEDFEELTGIKVNYTLFSTNEELYAKLKNNSSSYDVIVPSDYMIGRMIKEGLIQKINFNNIPNYKFIDKSYLNKSFDPNNEYSIPFYWGVVGIIYNTTMVDEEDLTGWNIFWNEKYAGNMFMFGNSRDAFAISLLDLGYSINTIDENEITEASRHLNAQKPLVQAYVMDEIYDKMEGGEAALAPYYNGDAVLMMDANEDLDFYIPDNTSCFIDSMVIPYNANQKEAAEMYINYMCEPNIGAANSYYVGYSTPMTESYLLLDEELQNNEIAYPDKEFVNLLDAFVTLPDNISSLIDQYWTDLMTNSSEFYKELVFLIFVFSLIAFIPLKSKYDKYQRNKKL